jgi:hypothetical protein
MADTPSKKTASEGGLRSYPKLSRNGDGEYNAEVPKGCSMEALTGMRTSDAASGVYVSSIAALGKWADRYGGLASAMFAEIEPRDAVEAMLVAQMTATHVAVTQISEKMTHQTSYQVRESYERSATRLSRTYLAQMDALKKYRAMAQQVVRVERVTVGDGGQAIVGHVSHARGDNDQKGR